MFCWHAFSRAGPLPTFDQAINDALRICGGLPLALKVLGDYLYRFRDIMQWKSEVAFFKENGVTAQTNQGVISVLRRTYVHLATVEWLGGYWSS
ncbi:hypothetical protein WJX72_000098 [[Myrmecia] bisecta]|uniref:NB-ARC domain-containing protein n=1 Tax=[Myrmecia] bisecta TaxID=41462 RepID=A0AAW1PN26_9CHLO